MILFKIILLSTCLTVALITGLFYSYSCSVNPGLSRLTDADYLRAMQSINRAILNGWFFVSFIGTLILLPVATWSMYRSETGSVSFYVLLAATLVYLVGVFGVTIIGNVPLNDMLDKYLIDASQASALRTQRVNFEKPWNHLHRIRTYACILSLILTLASVVMKIRQN